MASNIEKINTEKWITENQSSFLPPVCNKLMHNGQLVIMFVGGPNVREDYHIEEGEELFYQIKGDMCLKILENNCHKDIVIKEGEFFLLPAKIPHSPQRSAHSCGLVIERRREVNETDCVRWFVPGQSQVLYEKWFQCKDLGVELIPLIKNYFASDEYSTKIPGGNVCVESEVPFKLNPALIQKHLHGTYNLFEKINESSENNLVELSIPGLQFQVSVYKKGNHQVSVFGGLDQWLWQLKGTSRVCLGADNPHEMNANDSLLIPENYCQNLTIGINGDTDLLIKITQDPELKK